MRKLVLLLVLLAIATPRAAHAEVGLGLFVGEPTGLDVKLGLGRRSALDLLLGWYSHWDDNDRINDGAYFHATYLVTPVVSAGRSVIVPLRIGIGGALFDDAGRFDDHLHVAVRAPLEIALVFRSTPLEIYGEIALKATINDHDDRILDLDGGVGLRFYF